ncbi:MAG: putative capsular polysaccharide synthesis family protein [Desulfobacterales bacterium]
MRSTLRKYHHGPVVHAHNAGMLKPNDKTILKWRKRLRLPVYVICPIREPISRNISAFFQNFNLDTGLNFSDKNEWLEDEMLDLFLKHYTHNICLEWFDTNLRTTFGVDVFSQPFPIENKWKIYKHKSIRILVYRSDLDRSSQLDLISQFIGNKIPAWSQDNISAEKEYGEVYKKFCSSVKLPDIYISIMCDSKFCRKFWSENEIEAIKNRFKEKQTV